MFQPVRGDEIAGTAQVLVSRSSIAIHFTPDVAFPIAQAAYGEASGRIHAADGSWTSNRVNFVEEGVDGSLHFLTLDVQLSRAHSAEIVAVRLVFAGAAWDAEIVLDGRQVVVAGISSHSISHHDARMAIAVAGPLADAEIEIMGRAASLVSGLDLEPLRVEFLSRGGDIVETRHLRGHRRVGRSTHDPFSAVANADRIRAWKALVLAIPRLDAQGVPIRMMINHVATHNQVADINSAAPLLVLATLAVAYHAAHGETVGAGAASRRAELSALDRALDLGLGEDGLDRFEKLRVELLEAGFFHKPGYETGRPQKDIKFLRDLLHLIVFRLSGYEGPYYCSETASARTI